MGLVARSARTTGNVALFRTQLNCPWVRAAGCFFNPIMLAQIATTSARGTDRLKQASIAACLRQHQRDDAREPLCCEDHLMLDMSLVM